MSKKEILAASEQESGGLVEEIGELKEILRDVSRKLTRLETQVKRGVLSARSKTSDIPAGADVNKPANLSASNVLELYVLRVRDAAQQQESVPKKNVRANYWQN